MSEYRSVRCPDCGCDLVVDVATGAVVTHDNSTKKAGKGIDFEGLLDGLDEQKRRANALFEQGKKALDESDRLSDARFEEARKRADEDPSQKPKSPFDLD